MDPCAEPMPPPATAESLDLLSQAWCSSAIQPAPNPSRSHQNSLARTTPTSAPGNDGEVVSAPALKMDDLKSWIWLMQAIHPELDYDRCSQKKGRITPWTWRSAFSLKKWVVEMRQRWKEEERLHKAEVHAAVSVARLAAALAYAAAENAELSLSKTSRENAMASAAALVAAQCAQVAEAAGAKREHLESTMNAAMSATGATDILTLTAAAATSSRGAATLKGRAGRRSDGHRSCTAALPADDAEFNFGKHLDSLAKGAELPVVTPDGCCRIRLVSVFLDRSDKVVLRIKKINALMPLAQGKESIVHRVVEDAEAGGGGGSSSSSSPEGDSSSYLIAMATNRGTTKLKMKDYVCYKIWITSINHMLMLSSTTYYGGTDHQLLRRRTDVV